MQTTTTASTTTTTTTTTTCANLTWTRPEQCVKTQETTVDDLVNCESEGVQHTHF